MKEEEKQAKHNSLGVFCFKMGVAVQAHNTSIMEAKTGGFPDEEQPRLLLLSRPVWIIWGGRHENKQKTKKVWIFVWLFEKREN